MARVYRILRAHPLAGRILDHMHANIVFLGATGCIPSPGPQNISLPNAEVKQWMVRAATDRGTAQFADADTIFSTPVLLATQAK